MATDSRGAPIVKDGPLHFDGGGGDTRGCPNESDGGPSNNTPATGTKLSGSSGRLPGWEICYRGDIDCYRIRVDSAPGTRSELVVRVSFFHANGDLDAVLYDDRGALHSVSRSSDDDETLRALVTGLGVWVACVYGVGGHTNKYILDITVP